MATKKPKKAEYSAVELSDKPGYWAVFAYSQADPRGQQVSNAMTKDAAESLVLSFNQS